MARTGRWFMLLAALGLSAAPAGAEIFRVTLADGGVIETRYQPQESSWDPETVLLLTEVGNWIGLNRADIASVETDAVDRGYGFIIDNTTISLGWAPNDQPVPDPEAQADARLQALQNLIDQQRAPAEPYTIQQFVEPNQTQGIPGRMVGAPNGSERLGTEGFPF